MGTPLGQGLGGCTAPKARAKPQHGSRCCCGAVPALTRPHPELRAVPELPGAGARPRAAPWEARGCFCPALPARGAGPVRDPAPFPSSIGKEGRMDEGFKRALHPQTLWRWLGSLRMVHIRLPPAASGPKGVAAAKSQHRSSRKRASPVLPAHGAPSPQHFSPRAPQLSHPVALGARGPHGSSVPFPAASFSLEEGGRVQQPPGRAAASSKPRSEPSAPVPEHQRPALACAELCLAHHPRGETETREEDASPHTPPFVITRPRKMKRRRASSYGRFGSEVSSSWDRPTCPALGS